MLNLFFEKPYIEHHAFKVVYCDHAGAECHSGDDGGELLRQHLTHGNWDYLEPHAYEIMEHISDPAIRSLNITEG